MRTKNHKSVVITGIGMVTPLGNDRATSWAGIKSGKSGAGVISQFEADEWPVKIACEVKDFEIPQDAILDKHKSLVNRPAEFVAAAALEAMTDAGDLAGYQPEKFAVMTGSGIGSLRPREILAALSDYDLHPDLAGMASYLEISDDLDSNMARRQHPGTISALLSERWGARAPWSSHATACAAGAQAIIEAAERIRSGDIDVALCGGGDSISGELLLAGFNLLGVLSGRNDTPATASRPFDRERDGLVAGEGAAMLVVERGDLAIARGAHIYAEISGLGLTENAHRITDLPEDGAGAIDAMKMAIEDASAATGDVDYINAHGTSTEQNDRIEAMAIATIFGTHTDSPLVSSTKSQTGHFIAAAGAVEAAFTALAIQNNLAPATLNLGSSDCEPLNFVGPKPKNSDINFALSNSFGFGGTNACIAISTHRSKPTNTVSNHDE